MQSGIFLIYCECNSKKLGKKMTIAAAMTQGDITIKDVQVQHLGLIPQVFRRLGIEVWQKGDDLYVPSQEHYEIERFMDGSIMTVADAPWPGFTPDLISIALVVVASNGSSPTVYRHFWTRSYSNSRNKPRGRCLYWSSFPQQGNDTRHGFPLSR